MRPVGGERDTGAVAHRCEGEVADADELERDLSGKRPRCTGISLGHVDVEAARVRRVQRAGQHGPRAAVELGGGAAHATRIAEGHEQDRRRALHARAGAAHRQLQAETVVPCRRQARLQHVAVDLEDAAVARLGGGLGLDVERGGRLAEHELALLGDRLPVLSFALRHLPRFGAGAREHRAEHRLRGSQAGSDAGLGFAQAPLPFLDHAADGLQRDHEHEQNGAERDRLAE